MIIFAFLGLAVGYALFYAGLTGFLALMSGGRIKKQSVLGGLGITGASSLTAQFNTAQFNPFGAAGNAKSETTTAAYTGSPGAYVTPAEAPVAFLTGNGMLGQSPISGSTALGGGSGGVSA